MPNNTDLFEKYLNENRQSLLQQYSYNEQTRSYDAPMVPGNTVAYAVSSPEQIVQENLQSKKSQDHIPSFLDEWRVMNKKRAQVRLSEAQNDLRRQEATWLPQAEKALQYIQAAYNYQQLNQQDMTNWTDDQIQQVEQTKYNLLQTINQLEPEVKEEARTNPYIRGIFYETSVTNAVQNGLINPLEAAAKTALVDLDSSRIGDVNPSNNFEHLIEEGASDSWDRLNQDQINTLWSAKTNLNDINKLAQQVQEVTDAVEDAKAEYDSKVDEVAKRTRIINKGTWYFDPTKIDPRAQKAIDENELSLTDPISWYRALPELGSSYANIEAMVANMATDAIVTNLAKGALAVGSGGITPLLIGASELGIQWAVSQYGRQKETASEMFDAFQQAVTERVQQNNIDYNAVVDNVKSQLAEAGFDVDSMDYQQIFGNMLALGISTGNNELDQIIKDSEKGLNVVEQSNNALQLSDLIQSGIYSYGGRYVGNLMKLNASGSRAAGRMAESVTRGVDNTLATAPGSLASRAKQMVTNKLIKAATFGSTNTIKQNSARRIIDGIGNHVKKAAVVSFLEQQEEGQQYLISKEYQSGKYDNIEKYSLLDGLVNDVRLGVEARAAYYGLHTDDALNTDEELKRSMDIGGFTGLFMGGVGSTRNVYNGIKQLRTDRKLQELAANGYENAENDQKIEAFLNASNKSKNSLERIHNTLDMLKQHKPEGVTDDMIEADKELASRVFLMNKAAATRWNTRDLRFGKGSDTYSRYIHNALLWSDKERKQRESAEVSIDRLTNLQNQVLNYKRGQNDVLDAALDQIKTDYTRSVEMQSYEAWRSGKTSDVQEVAELTDQQILNEALRFIQLQTLHDLSQQTANRATDLRQLAQDKGLDVNLDGINGISKHVNKLFKDASKNKVYAGLQDVVNAMENADEISKAIAESTLNSAALNDILQHKRAYTTGLYTGDTSIIKPTWNNLTEAQRQDVIDDYVQESIREGKVRPSKEEIIEQYNKEIEDKWKAQDETADQRGVQHQRALSVIRRDLARREQLEQIAERENADMGVRHPDRDPEPPSTDSSVTGQSPENQTTPAPSSKPVIQQEPQQPQSGETKPVSEQQPTPITTPSTGEDVADAQGAIDALNHQLSDESAAPVTQPHQPAQPRETPPQDSMEEYDDAVDMSGVQESAAPRDNLVVEEPEDVTTVRLQTEQVEEQPAISDEELQNPPELISGRENEESPVSMAENIEKGNTVDLDPVAEETAQPEVIQSVTESTVSTPEIPVTPQQPEEQSKPVNSVEPTTKTESNTQPVIKEDKTVEVINTGDPNNDQANPSFVVADATNIEVLDNGQVGINMSGLPGDIVSLDPAMIFAQNAFDSLFDTASSEASDIQGSDEYIDKTKGLSNDKKQKKNLMRNTFFFQPTATEPMVLKANGKDVIFTTKDGKKAKRGTGKMLADKLAQPGWLQSQVVDAYYIVTDAWKDDRRISNSKNVDSAVNNAAIHMILEDKDGYVYTVSLRTPQRAEYELRDLGVNKADRDKEVEALSIFRRQILNAYCPEYTNGKPLPQNPLKDCKPVNLRISNGTINNNPDQHQFRKLTEVSDLNLSDDPYVLTDMLEEGELEIGIGKGAFTLSDPFSIVKLSNTDEMASSQGIGYAGKLYLIPKVSQTPSQRIAPPIMLTEQKHTIPGVRIPGDLKLTYNAKHQVANVDNLPSTAELVYEMVTSNLFGDERLTDFFLSILARTGIRTVPRFDSEQTELDFYRRKALSVTMSKDGKPILLVGMVSRNDANAVQRELKHTVHRIPLETITEGTRRNVIFSISQNLHWNTDKELLMSRIPDYISDYIIKIARDEYLNVGKKLTDTTDIEVLGPEVAFTLRDIGYTIDDQGNITKVREGEPAPSVMAWMINHGHIMIDSGEHLFKAPFVFASGVTVVDNPVHEQQSQPKVPEQPTVARTEPVQTTQTVTHPIVLPTAQTEVQSQQSTTPQEQQKPKGRTIKVSEIHDGQRVEVEYTVLPENEKNIGRKPIQITEQSLAEFGLSKPTESPLPGWKWVIWFGKDGTPKLLQINQKRYMQEFGRSSYKREGWYSTGKGRGKLNASKAKSWLNRKLGLSDEDVMITSAVMRTHSDDKAYGVMRVVWNKLRQEFNPQIVLSQEAGRDVTYHEAWHYVSQLLLTDQQRTVLYQDYIDRHPKAKNYTKEQVEEAMAEEFREYMAGIRHIFQSYRLVKFFDRLGRMLHLDFLRPSLHTQMYASINHGEFAKYKPSQSVLREFSEAYDSGLHFYIPGLTKEEYDRIPNITDGETFYNIIRSLTSSVLAYSQIRTQDDLQKGLDLNKMFSALENQLNEGAVNPDYELIANDVLINRALFSRYIRDYLADLGIDKEITDTRLAELDDEQRQAVETGDLQDNSWDVEQGAVSKKDKLAFNARLFFYSIPNYEFVTYEDENGNVVRVPERTTDDIFGLDQPVPFSLAWNKVMENLWNIDSFDEMVAQCDRLGRTDPFFVALKEKLTDQQNPLNQWQKAQLEVAIKSSKNGMTTVKIQQDRPDMAALKAVEQIDDPVTAVTEKNRIIEEAKKRSIWQAMNSSNLTKIARYPRQWSLAFFSSDNTIIPEGSDIRTINPLIIKKITDSQNTIGTLLKKRNSKDTDKVALLDQLKSELVDLLNALYIPVDIPTLDYMLDNMKSIDKDGNYLSELDRFNILWSSDRAYQLKAVLKNIKDYARNPRKAKNTLNRIFTVPPSNINAFISLAAVAYGNVHPSPEEFSVTGADGSLRYPISENNYMSDQIRWLNKGLHDKANHILNSKFGSSSLIAKLAGKDGVQFKLNTLLAVDEQQSQSSRDYFGISPIEDYITKLTLTNDDQMILPTMSDKKTWYSISGMELLHETLTSAHQVNQRVGGVVQTTYQFGERRFSDRAINIFSDYFMSELDAVIDYYNKMDYVAANPEKWRKNYHGKIKNGKMQPGGNGGRFRYFSTVWYNGKEVHLNNDLSKLENLGQYNAVKSYLQTLRDTITRNNNQFLHDIANNYLIDMTNREVNNLINMGIIRRDGTGLLHNELIPHNIIASYLEQDTFKRNYPNGYSMNKTDDVIYSIIGSHVANQAISIQEVERCFTGDPAYYKWQTVPAVYKLNDDNFEPVVIKGGLKKYKELHPEINVEEYGEYDVITGRDVDKTKRLSSVLSTGSDMVLDWGENDERNNTEYTVLNLSDNMVSSPFYNDLLDTFKLSLARDEYESQHSELSIQEVYDTVTPETVDNIINQFDEATRKRINDMAKLSARPYADGEINQSDAAVYMRPAMWRRLMMAQGKWNDKIERAYRIVEANDAWMSNYQLYQLAKPLILNVQKMVYMGDTYDDSLGLDIPVFNKMAIFPMFKSLCKADNKLIYNRMNNEELGTIDMIVFESAVKVGLGQTVKMYKDEANTQLNVEMLSKASYTKTKMTGDLPVKVQDIKHLRLQLNTDPHEHMDRSFGTQAVKMVLSNLRDDLTYGTNKGKAVKGSELKSGIMDCINQLTRLGANEIRHRFFKRRGHNWVIDNRKLSDELVKEARQSGLSEEVVQCLTLDENGEFNLPVAALSSRNWIESRVISIVNKAAVDINTKGGAAIQMSNFGFKLTQPIEYTQGELHALNNGQALKFLRDNGSMEIMLSTNFFRHIVPKEKQATFASMRQWLLDNNIIGENSQPIGLGYRIPTQGSSSTFAFTVMDVLPETYADTIVVPDGFTAMTGSDYDVDKLYIAMYDFENGKKVEYDDSKPIMEWTREELTNKMLEYQMMCISDTNNMAETKASIDTLTSFLKNDVLPLVQPASLVEARPGYELLPSFQLSRKIEYTSGKAGIAPFALNSTNHALTQFAHLCMEYANGNPYNLGQLDAIKGQDGFRILDWLSAMINAHVDVAKDPYIIALNVNQITYNMTNLLLRGGKGQTTFYFLAQDILKLYSAKQIANRGVYGVDPNITEQKVRAQFYNQFEKILYNAIQVMPQGQERTRYTKLYNGWLQERGFSKNKPIGEQTEDNMTPVQRSWALDRDRLISSLKADKLSAEYAYQQLLVLKAYDELNQDAKRLAKLVKISQIDTKKYGNTLATQLNFKNMVNSFAVENGSKFFINNATVSEDTDAIDYYMNVTFLGQKLYYAMSLPRAILRKQSIVATKEYEDIYINVMRTFVGPSEDDSMYQYTNDQEFVTQVNRALESVVRARISANSETFNIEGDELYNMFVGSGTACKNLNNLKRYIISNKEQLPNLVNQDGVIKNALLNYLQEYSADGTTHQIDRIVLANSSMNNDRYTENILISAFDELLTSEDEYVRDVAESLARYSYFTSYDNRGVNSFFHLVPMWWKIQHGYASNMKKALNKFGDVNTEAGYMVAEDVDDPKTGYYPSISTTIARNMWYNKEIVKPYSYDNNTDMILRQSLDSQRTNVLFASRSATDRYITIGDRLYRKVGDIAAIRKSDDKLMRYSVRGIYLLTPKLGINDDGNHIYEYVNQATQDSAFPENNLANSAYLNGEDIAQIIKDQNDFIIDKVMRISARNRVTKNEADRQNISDYELVYKNLDGINIDAKTSQSEQETYFDPGMDEYSGVDTSMITGIGILPEDMIPDIDPISEQSTDVLLQQNEAVTSMPDALSQTIDMFDTAGAMMQTMTESVNMPETDINEAVSREQSELNDMAALGEQIKNKCKGK